MGNVKYICESRKVHVSSTSEMPLPSKYTHIGWFIIYKRSAQHFQCGDRLYTSESDVCRCHILTYKDGPRTERIKTCLMVVVLYHRYSNESDSAIKTIYDKFKLKKPFSLHGRYKYMSVLSIYIGGGGVFYTYAYIWSIIMR